MRKTPLFLLLAALFQALSLSAQTVNPQAYYVNSDNVQQETRSITDGQAPLDVTFRSNPSGMDDYTPSYEWHFRRQRQNEPQRELFVRYEEDTQYTFTESGTYTIVQKTRLEQDGIELDSVAITIVISDSRLEFPNAFSPNDDKQNDVFKAKDGKDGDTSGGYKNIIEFHAYIFNRWGQKLFEWTDISEGWDGTYRGSPVKDGVYFLLCRAKGADGKEYNIRKDVNLLRGFTEGGQTSGGQQ